MITLLPARGPGVSGQRFVRNSLLLVTIELMTKLLGLVLFVLMTRFLGAREVGLYAFAVAVADFFVIAPRFGFEKVVLQQVGRDATLLHSYFWDISAVKALLSVGALALLWLFLLTIGEAQLLTIMMIACFTFVYSFVEFINALFRGIQRAELEVIVRTFFSVANLVLGAMVLYAGWGLTGLVTTQLAVVGFAMMLGVLVIERVSVKVRHNFAWHTLWGHLIAAAPFAAIRVAGYFSVQVAFILLSVLVEKEQVGYFAAAFRLFHTLTLIPAAIMGAFVPTMSRLYRTSLSAFVRTLRFTLKYLFILSTPMAVGAVILAQPIVDLLYGEPFAPSARALQILSSALIFNFWNFVGYNMLIARNRQRLLVGLMWLVAVVYVSANLLLIPTFLSLGPCWAFLMTEALLFLILLSFLRRYLGARTLLQIITVPALCAGIMGGVVFTMRDWNLWLVILTGAVIYAAGLLASGAVRRRDLDGLQRMIPGQPEPSFPEA